MNVKKNSLYKLISILPKPFLLNEINIIKNKKLKNIYSKSKLKKSFPKKLFKSIEMQQPINHISFSPINNCFSICCDFLIRFLKIKASMKKSFEFGFNLDYTYINYIKNLCFSPCGEYFAFISDTTVRILRIIKYLNGLNELNGLNDNEIGAELAYLIESDHKKHITELAFSPSSLNKFFATSSRDKTVKLYELNLGLDEKSKSHKLLKTFTESQEKVLCIAFSPITGNFLASAGVDDTCLIYGVDPVKNDSFCKHYIK